MKKESGAHKVTKSALAEHFHEEHPSVQDIKMLKRLPKSSDEVKRIFQSIGCEKRRLLIKQRNEEISRIIKKRLNNNLLQIATDARKLNMSFILNRPSSLILEEPIKKIKMRKNTQISNFNDETTSRTKTATNMSRIRRQNFKKRQSSIRENNDGEMSTSINVFTDNSLFKFADDKSTDQNISRGAATPQVIHQSRFKTINSQRNNRAKRKINKKKSNNNVTENSVISKIIKKYNRNDTSLNPVSNASKPHHKRASLLRKQTGLYSNTSQNKVAEPELHHNLESIEHYLSKLEILAVLDKQKKDEDLK